MRLTIETKNRQELIPELDRMSLDYGIHEKNGIQQPAELRVYTKGGHYIKIIYSDDSKLSAIFFAIRNAMDKGSKGYVVYCEDMKVEG